MLESSHGGVFTDRLAVAGSENQLLYWALVLLSNTIQSHALERYTGTGTRLGLYCPHNGWTPVIYIGDHWMKARNGILLYCRITPNTRIVGFWSVRLKEKE